jgi:hypothetical protein
MEALPGHEAIKIITSLLVSGGTKGEGTDGPWGHGIVMLFMRLDILSIFDAAVFIVVDAESSDDRPGTQGLRDAEPVWKCLDPKNTEKNHFNDHARREVVKWCDVVCAVSPFFERANASFNVRNVLLFATDVELGS